MCYSLILFVILQNLRFVNLNSCSWNNCLSRLKLIQNEIIFVTKPTLLTVKIRRSPNLAIITFHFGWYKNLLSLIFTFLSEHSNVVFQISLDLCHDSWNIKKQRVLLIWNNWGQKKASYNSKKIVKISNLFDIFTLKMSNLFDIFTFFSNCSYNFCSC